ncbi:RNA polymerase sigma-70 factor [Sphingobacterium sp. UT-1RO-CII-1]|uniref:RNA polymerase sigma-70 factor n=1 Tax=Sphingobacterium sp. UT-1RO-CII-1 TaxID=2995225 RepID=UPI00227BE435|nr:RNA polymerase sigma-70 factor [Sphingobacterium sp. UT-1RO-CII-1]MCY4779621.1 RNA polymerase sigma-70 factor [Sphingobacterium sp. UT-1RO-CII-1]
MTNEIILSDEQLLCLLQQGDEPAFTEIYTRYSRKLLAIAFNYARDPDLAEEIVQDIFLSLWERRLSLKIDSLEAYLATAVKFAIFRQIYTQKKRLELAKNHYKVQTAILDEDKIYAKFLDEYIQGIAETLPEKCRLVFQYSRNMHLNNKEIAEKMNISEKTVESHMTKALKTIRNNLSNSGTIITLTYSFLEKFIK